MSVNDHVGHVILGRSDEKWMHGQRVNSMLST
jgi:hypothetical protein